MALWFNAPALDRKIEGSRPAANSYFERTTKTREKEETNLETDEKKKARPQNKRPWTRRASALENVSLDPKLLSVNEKRTRFEGCGLKMWIERPFTTREAFF